MGMIYRNYTEIVNSWVLRSLENTLGIANLSL